MNKKLALLVAGAVAGCVQINTKTTKKAHEQRISLAQVQATVHNICHQIHEWIVNSNTAHAHTDAIATQAGSAVEHVVAPYLEDVLEEIIGAPLPEYVNDIIENQINNLTEEVVEGAEAYFSQQGHPLADPGKYKLYVSGERCVFSLPCVKRHTFLEDVKVSLNAEGKLVVKNNLSLTKEVPVNVGVNTDLPVDETQATSEDELNNAVASSEEAAVSLEDDSQIYQISAGDDESSLPCNDEDDEEESGWESINLDDLYLEIAYILNTPEGIDFNLDQVEVHVDQTGLITISFYMVNRKSSETDFVELPVSGNYSATLRCK